MALLLLSRKQYTEAKSSGYSKLLHLTLRRLGLPPSLLPVLSSHPADLRGEDTSHTPEVTGCVVQDSHLGLPGFVAWSLGGGTGGHHHPRQAHGSGWGMNFMVILYGHSMHKMGMWCVLHV